MSHTGVSVSMPEEASLFAFFYFSFLSELSGCDLLSDLAGGPKVATVEFRWLDDIHACTWHT